jgi:hypothetical protein
MSHPKIQNCGTACCDCTVACKYTIIEDLCAQEDELFAQFLAEKKEQGSLNFLVIEPILGANERAIFHKVDRLFMKYVENMRTRYFGGNRPKCRGNVLFNKAKVAIITILG